MPWGAVRGAREGVFTTGGHWSMIPFKNIKTYSYELDTHHVYNFFPTTHADSAHEVVAYVLGLGLSWKQSFPLTNWQYRIYLLS